MLLKQPHVPLARSGGKNTKDQDGPFLLHDLWGGLVLGPGALPVSDNIQEGSSWPWPKFLGYDSIHKRRTAGLRTTSREVSGRLSVTAEVVPYRRTREVLISVRFRSE